MDIPFAEDERTLVVRRSPEKEVDVAVGIGETKAITNELGDVIH